MIAKDLGILVYKTLKSKLEQLDKVEFNGWGVQLFHFLLDKFTESERVHFTTLFSKIAYIGTKYKFDRTQLFHIHGLRKELEEGIANHDKSLKELIVYVCCHLTKNLSGLPIPDNLQSLIKEFEAVPITKTSGKRFIKYASGAIVGVNKETEQFYFAESRAGHDLIKVAYNIQDRNANFNKSLGFILQRGAFPVDMNLLEIEVDEDNIYYPKAFVLDPDYMIDVTAIAEGFRDFGTHPRLYLLKKFLPFKSTHYLLLGNIANDFLDLLISNPSLRFEEVQKRMFERNPISFSVFDDKLTREIVVLARMHFNNLKKAITESVLNKRHRDNIYLEPSFYSRMYGIQGRLDLFHVNLEAEEADIIELKSGKAYKPNAYGLSINHYTQTLLYDLIIRSVFGTRLKPSNYILYSSQEHDALKFAPSVKAQQNEAIQLRNQLIIIEKLLEDPAKNLKLFDSIKPENFKSLSGFSLSDVDGFQKIYAGLDDLEKAYFSHFTSFIAKEHHLAKTGQQNIEKRSGLASMWNKSVAEKEIQFNIISYLKVDENASVHEEPIIRFKKTDLSNKLDNFRIGDIGVLYPYTSGSKSALKNQIFKCTILRKEDEYVEVRLRNQQFNQEIFKVDYYWHIEHDILDSGFNKMYQGLYAFSSSTPDRRKLLLSRRAPNHSRNLTDHKVAEMTPEQVKVFNEAISAEEYYLIWGPPGTGKTSIMIKNVVKYLYENTSENILLLAYTNRAVDELCHAIEAIQSPLFKRYIRIGSRYSCKDQFKSRLFDSLASNIHTRQEIKQLIGSNRIFVSTISSILGKPEFFDLNQFDRIIIDEASQILEPYLIGLLSKDTKIIMVGDHKQLPAVVVQHPFDSKVEHTGLQEIGLKNMRDSLFERLYGRCLENNWHWAIGQLNYQGRMHKKILHFPNKHFYSDQLKIIPSIDRLSQSLKDSMAGDSVLTNERLIYIPCNIDDDGKTNKTNTNEAVIVQEVIRRLLQIYEHNKVGWTRATLGVITPFRAQIAKINHILGDEMVKNYSISVDTVERYQGGARDIIIISFCANDELQLKTMSSLSSSGVDRKLNVALTRAKEQIIFIGNEEILTKNPIYQELIHMSYKWESFA